MYGLRELSLQVVRKARLAGARWRARAHACVRVGGFVGLCLPGLPQVSLEGRWSAEARLGPEAMTLVLDVEEQGERFRGRLSVPAERVLGLSLEDFDCKGNELSFRIPHPDRPQEFSGQLVDGRLEGTLAMGHEELPIVFLPMGPTPAVPYREVEVRFAGAERTVEGSMLVPPGDGPHGALVLFHATSTPRRDELRFLADQAARAGLVTLIYDRRSVPLDLTALTRADFLAVVADAEAAVTHLRTRAEVDPSAVGVGGLSQGAWVAAQVAVRVPEVAFLLALSPPGLPLHELDIHQSLLRLEAAGVQPEERNAARELLSELFAASRGGEVSGTLPRRLAQARNAPWSVLLALPAEVPPAGAAGALLRWSAHDLDPALFFERLRVPVLLAFGARDERLPAERCEQRLRACLTRAGNEAVTVRVYPHANHALLPAPAFEADLARWLGARAR